MTQLPDVEAPRVLPVHVAELKEPAYPLATPVALGAPDGPLGTIVRVAYMGYLFQPADGGPTVPLDPRLERHHPIFLPGAEGRWQCYSFV